MKFSYNWLCDYIGKKISAEEMAGLLTMHSFQVESAEKRDGDSVFDIDVLPNRAHDCFSHLGVSREAAVNARAALKMPPGASARPAFREDKEKIGQYAKIAVQDAGGAPRYTLRLMKGVKVGPSPRWIRERLTAVGQKPINNIVDIANFVMLELGQPLHAFDFDKLAGKAGEKTKTIFVRYARKGEEIMTLDDKRYDLSEKVLVIADSQKPIAIAGIKGGSGPRIDEKTAVIALESATFDPQVIRSGSRVLDLKTDASMRFEQGIDPNLTEIALNRACCLIQKCAGGKVLKGMLDFYPRKVLPKRIRLGLEKVNRLAGFEFSLPQLKKIMGLLGFKAGIASAKAGELLIEVPTGRMDIEMPEDLIEEICRIYGYEKIPGRVPEAVLIPPKRDDRQVLTNKIRELLEGLGFFEAYNLSFTGDREIEALAAKKGEFLELENPVSQDLKYLRSNLFAGLLNNVRENLKNFDGVKIYEVGKVFQTGPKESWHFSGVAARRDEERAPGELFYEVKGAIDSLLDELGVDERWYDNVEPTPEETSGNFWDLARSAEIKIGGEEFGFLGEVSPRVLAKFGIKTRVAAFDFDLENLLGRVEEEWEYTPIPKYPSVTRDIAILVDKETRITQVLNVVYGAGVKYLEDVDLFDAYEGEELSDDRKSLAFHLIFQAADHTLTDAEIKEEVEKIVKALREELRGELRGKPEVAG